MRKKAPPRNSRFGASRPRGRTTPASSESNKEESTTSASTASTHHRPQPSRARPGLNLRPRGRGTTAAPPTGEAKEESLPADVTSTTARSRKVNSAPGIRPLRPGPRINLSGRGRGASTTTTEASAEDHVTGDDDHETTQQEASEKEETPTAPADNGPLSKLKNKGRLNVQARPKPAASAPVQVRRVNPLLGRRRPGHTTEAAPTAPSSEAPGPVTDPVEEVAETEAPSSTTTTEEPRGLNRLLAGRKRLGQRTPGTLG
ncbi:unnamed protein product [Callosobruchus maculatus]|uniref:Uncharacterized protein n=1 Tax=Callosobruchus maculatus TaxID=64391 RepID=A0A653CBI6_CALMS|nr:unnamed protein product [Callosobruchus maculatus]